MVVIALCALGSVHTVFSTECSPYFDWQSIGVAHTHKLVGQPGPITRLSACPEEKRNAERDAQIIATHYHPTWEVHPTNNDTYSAYNMPASVIHWMEHTTVREEYVLYMDGDMTFRRPVDPAALGVRKGVAVGARYEYLYGLTNGIIQNFGVPNAELAPHVGGIYILHADDFRALAPRWLHWTERFRKEPFRYWADASNPEASAEDLATGDLYVARGRAPWISAMYGYAFAAAELGIVHVLPDDLMFYAGGHWLPVGAPTLPMPMIVHYGLPLVESGHAFDKQWYRELDVLDQPCPPRYLLVGRLSVLAVLANGSLPLVDKAGALITIETLCTLNEALGAFYAQQCAPRAAADQDALARLLPPDCPLREATAALSSLEVCRDSARDCARHDATSCAAEPEHARALCRRSCRACSTHDRGDARTRQAVLDQLARWDALPRARIGPAAADLAGAAECELVAARGQCASHDSATRCARSCNSALGKSGRRHNDSPHCATWAKTGQCWHNRPQMERHCPESCTFNADPLPTAEGTSTCEAGAAGCGERATCADETTSCRSWALRGECDANEAFMAVGCCKACAEWRAHQGQAA
ncbi:hypothetical protein KFE25_009029 [Diacronema lutheri]|uniref:ShKT domain-containing protein n=2 Tax=Diacronema lutheri TaxID=2081491 RepID=A0A8J5XRX7_DIALT|nr:hypothetical protein KFE25_009029 [Diacronema lutheri]